MEFKGTKGRWRLEKSLFYETNKIILSQHRVICRITIEDDESESNALLISKAPELLEMVNELLLELEFHGYRHSTTINNARQLIKQATEI